jgi:hypothetical protein
MPIRKEELTRKKMLRSSSTHQLPDELPSVSELPSVNWTKLFDWYLKELMDVVRTDDMDDNDSTVAAEEDERKSISECDDEIQIPDSAPTIDMSDYVQHVDDFNGCIDAASMAQLANGATKSVGELQKGDIIAGPGDMEAEVMCVVHSKCVDGLALLVQLPGGTRVTPYHPVQVDGTWRFPVELAQAQVFPCEAVCGIVLRGAPALLVGGVPCVGLGHGLREGAAKHSYFGTTRVLRDLRASPEYLSGRVELRLGDASWVRNPRTGRVCGLRFTSDLMQRPNAALSA